MTTNLKIAQRALQGGEQQDHRFRTKSINDPAVQARFERPKQDRKGKAILLEQHAGEGERRKRVIRRKEREVKMYTSKRIVATNDQSIKSQQEKAQLAKRGRRSTMKYI